MDDEKAACTWMYINAAPRSTWLNERLGFIRSAGRVQRGLGDSPLWVLSPPRQRFQKIPNVITWY